MSTPMDQIEQLVASSDLVFLVVYRGNWCPFCISYLKKLQRLTPSINGKSGVVVAVTSQPADKQVNTREASGYEGTIITDEKNELAAALKKRDILDVAISEKQGYEHGMMQPAVLVLRNWDDVLYKWAIVPSLMNIGGAKDRPELEQVWDNVVATLDGKAPKHSRIQSISALGVIREKIFG